MAGRVPILVGVLAIAGLVAWFALREGRRTASDPALAPALAPAPAPTPAPDRTGLAPTSAPAGPALPSTGEGSEVAQPPTLPELPALPATPPAQATFVGEVRDDAWAATTEREIETRFGKLRRGGKLASTECRTAQCRLVITGTQDDVGDTIADLEGSRGMHGFAQHVLLTAPAKQPDGSVELQAFLRFER